MLLAGPGESLMRRRLGEGFPSGALAEFSITGAWAALGEMPARLTRFLAPRDLSPAGG